MFKLADDLRARLDKDLCARLDEDHQKGLRRSLRETVLELQVTWTPALAKKARRRAQELDEPEPEPVAWFFKQEQDLRAAGRGDLTEAVRGFEETGNQTLARKAKQLARLLGEPEPQPITRHFKQAKKLRKKALRAVRKSCLREALVDFEMTRDSSLAREVRKLARLLGEPEPELITTFLDGVDQRMEEVFKNPPKGSGAFQRAIVEAQGCAYEGTGPRQPHQKYRRNRWHLFLGFTVHHRRLAPMREGRSEKPLSPEDAAAEAEIWLSEHYDIKTSVSTLKRAYSFYVEHWRRRHAESGD